MILLALILASTSFAASLEVSGALSAEGGLRLSDTKSDTTRFQALVGGKATFQKVPIELAASGWAWQNFSSGNYGLTENEIAVLSATVSYWGDYVGVSLGLQQIHWGETFGFQPIDLINARNYRDYSLLNAERNRIPAPLLQSLVTLGQFKVSAIGNPRGEIPLLPEKFNGMPVVVDSAYRKFFDFPEYGGRVSWQLNNSNIDAFVYRHLNRFPVLYAVPSANPTLEAYFDTVTSVGTMFSRGFDEWVIRVDALYTPSHPAAVVDQTVLKKNMASVTAGADWSPNMLENFTVGLQGHWDRYPLSGTDTVAAGSLLIRKGFWNQKFELEGQVYQAANVSDRRGQLALKVHVGDSWEMKALGEYAHIDENSPVRFLKPSSRVATLVAYKF